MSFHVTEYIRWRGDLPFEACALNEVDNLIFCLLSYVDFDHVMPSDSETRVTLREVAKEYFFTHDEEKRNRPLGLIVPAEILDLFRQMAEAPRYKDVKLFRYVNEISEERELQFSAITAQLTADTYFVAIRGTDDTIVGWREDFNLSWMDEVPAQRLTATYINQLSESLPEGARLYVGGHSKGGNLAVWGAVHADETAQARILHVYSNDGPGFTDDMLKSEAYARMKDRLTCFVPPSSLVGLLLEHDDYEVIRSSQVGIFQHNGLSWEVMGACFLRESQLSGRGRRNDTVVRERIARMSREEKRLFTKLFFGILESTGARTLTELNQDSLRNAITMFRTLNDQDKDTKELAIYLLTRLFDIKPLLPVVATGRSLRVEFRWQWRERMERKKKQDEHHAHT